MDATRFAILKAARQVQMDIEVNGRPALDDHGLCMNIAYAAWAQRLHGVPPQYSDFQSARNRDPEVCAWYVRIRNASADIMEAWPNASGNRLYPVGTGDDYRHDVLRRTLYTGARGAQRKELLRYLIAELERKLG